MNECEDILGRIEQELAAPAAPIQQLATLVSTIPSATVSAPRNLSAVLLGRLEEIAEAHGGQVPLHGRLFSQWLHHAFPRECPYPHEVGTTSPMTPEEWMAETGIDVMVTDVVLQEHVNASRNRDGDVEVE